MEGVMAPAALCTIRTEDRSRAPGAASRERRQYTLGGSKMIWVTAYRSILPSISSASTQTGKQPAVPPMMLHWRLNKSNGMLDILKPYGL